MSHRWSFVRRFGRITHKDFLSLARNFVEAIVEEDGEPLVVSVVLYKELPRRNTAPREDVGDWTDTENKKKEFVNATFPAGSLSQEFLELHVSEMDYKLAANVQLSICSADTKDNTQGVSVYGTMECKGLYSDRVVYYLTSRQHEDYIYIRCTTEKRPSRWLFRKGSGRENCCSVSMS